MSTVSHVRICRGLSKLRHGSYLVIMVCTAALNAPSAKTIVCQYSLTCVAEQLIYSLPWACAEPAAVTLIATVAPDASQLHKSIM